MKFRKKAKSRQAVPLTTRGYTPKPITIKETRPKKEKKSDVSHAAGPLRKTPKTSNLQDVQYDEDIINNWTPHMQMSVANPSNGKPLTAKQVEDFYPQDPKALKAAAENMQKLKMLFPSYFINPMQDLDYIVIEAVLKNSFIGAMMNAYTRYICGTGFRPEIELINPDSEDDQKNLDEIKKYQYVVEELNEIDRQVDTNNPGEQDVTFQQKLMAAIDAMNSFNRAALMFSYDRKISVNGKHYPEIPSSVNFAHPRDLGIIEVTSYPWKLKAVQWRQAYYMVPVDDMIYLWNPLVTAKYHDAWFYGGSMVLTMLDAARVIRKIIGIDFPAMAEATWAGMFVLTVKPQGQDLATKMREYTQVTQNMVRGGPNVLMEDPANVGFNTIDFQPKVLEFKELVDFLIRYSVACIGMPQTMFFDEGNSTRDTMLGKIDLAKATTLEPMQEQIGAQINAQWYSRWFKLLHGKDKELMENIRIKVVWDDLNTMKWYDKIEATKELDGRKQLTDKAFGEEAGVENYMTKVDPNAETNPGGDSKKIQMPDGQGGMTEIKQKKSKQPPPQQPPKGVPSV